MANFNGSVDAGKAQASLSLDLDNKWSYLKTHGNTSWQEYPSYLPYVVPRILELLARKDLAISFFIVGKDASRSENHEPIASIADAGHEIANHSFNHDPWLHRYSEAELAEELERAENSIGEVTNVRTVGFRGPGFSLSASTLKVLAEREYLYDATVFPNLLNPLARAYFFASSNLSAEEKEERKELFGTWRDALRPVRPFRWSMTDKTLLEIPVTTMPFFKVPIHLSYLLYLSKYSKFLAFAYLKVALAACRWSNTRPSILLHPLDFMGKEDEAELAFFPGMDIPRQVKLDLTEKILDVLAKDYELVTMRTHAESVAELPLRTLTP